MRILRSFFPIGQGAFFRETFLYGENKYNVIYDCGSSSNSVLVETTIRNEFSKDETIDALFISHFDEDHINGIPFLLEYCNVRRIFFPLLTTRDKIALNYIAFLQWEGMGWHIVSYIIHICFCRSIANIKGLDCSKSARQKSTKMILTVLTPLLFNRDNPLMPLGLIKKNSIGNLSRIIFAMRRDQKYIWMSWKRTFLNIILSWMQLMERIWLKSMRSIRMKLLPPSRSSLASSTLIQCACSQASGIKHLFKNRFAGDILKDVTVEAS